MALEWKHSTDGVDWEELSALYRAAPLGDKKPLHLRTVFSNSMFKCFVYENARLVEGMLADGTLERLHREKAPGCYLHRSHPSDVARTEPLRAMKLSSSSSMLLGAINRSGTIETP